MFRSLDPFVDTPDRTSVNLFAQLGIPVNSIYAPLAGDTAVPRVSF